MCEEIYDKFRQKFAPIFSLCMLFGRNCREVFLVDKYTMPFRHGQISIELFGQTESNLVKVLTQFVDKDIMWYIVISPVAEEYRLHLLFALFLC